MNFHENPLGNKVARVMKMVHMNVRAEPYIPSVTSLWGDD